MKTFIIISIISGAISGTILGIMNLGIVEPVLDKAIGIEIQNQSQGNTIDEQEIQSYRIWQKSGQIVAGIVLGVSFGALLGISFIFGKKDTSWFNQSKEGHGFSWDHMVSNFLDSHVEVSRKSTHSERF